jgi:surface antigen
MRAILCLALPLFCAACTRPAYTPPPTAIVIPQSAARVSAAPQNCREYTTPVLVGGRSETASGVACEQADGSWRIVDNTPGLPPQSYTMPPPGSAQEVAGTAPPGQPDCREYTVPITVGTAQKQGVGESCRQPDGSWRIVEDTPGLPQQVYLVPPPLYPPPGYVYDPWLYGPPFALTGSFLFFHRFHHFDHGHDHDHGHHGSRGSWHHH